MFSRELAEAGEESVLRQHYAHIGGNGLDDNRGDIFFVLGEKVLDGAQIVVGRVDGEGGEGLGNAGALGDTKCGEAGAGFGEEAVGMTVIAAAEFHDVIALGDAAREADGAHGGFGAAGYETDFFEPGDGAVDQRGEWTWCRWFDRRDPGLDR